MAQRLSIPPLTLHAHAQTTQHAYTQTTEKENSDHYVIINHEEGNGKPPRLYIPRQDICEAPSAR